MGGRIITATGSISAQWAANGSKSATSATGTDGRKGGQQQASDKSIGQQASTDQLSTGQRVESGVSGGLSLGAAAVCASEAGKVCGKGFRPACIAAVACAVVGTDIASEKILESASGQALTPAVAQGFSAVTGVSPEAAENGQQWVFAITGGLTSIRQPTAGITFSPVASSAAAEVRFYESFNAFKKAEGAAGPGMAWHHIVEQTPANVLRFGNTLIHNTANLIRLPHGKGTIHNQISAFYSSKQPFTGGQTVRQWLSSKTYDEQMAFGKSVMERFGGK
jgi:hypothetical protein